jgi:hypothetical protein
VTFKHTVVGEVLPKLRAEELPLYRLLDRIADPTLDEKYRDEPSDVDSEGPGGTAG